MISESEPSTASRTAGRIKAVCLDIDDTLLDNATSSRMGLRALIGNDAAWPVWRSTTEEHYARFVTGEVDFATMCRERTRAFFAAFGEQLCDSEAAAREDYRMAEMQRAWRLFDDALPCLEWMRASGLRLAVITNSEGAYQRKKISDIGLAEAFDDVVISGELGVAKPDPRIFQAACTAVGAEPHEVVHVGDRLDTDALGAARAGLHGVWLNRSGTEHAPPDQVSMISSLTELPELLVCDLPATVELSHALPRAQPAGSADGAEAERRATAPIPVPEAVVPETRAPEARMPSSRKPEDTAEAPIHASRISAFA